MSTTRRGTVEKWGPDGKRQSQIRERIRRQVSALLPDFDFTRYPVLTLPYRARVEGQPAWSIAAVRTGDGQGFDVTCMESMSDCLRYGMTVLSEDSRAHWIQLMVKG